MKILMVYPGDAKDPPKPFYGQEAVSQWKSLVNSGVPVAAFSISDVWTVSGVITRICL
jgi:hypothetical protein